MKLQRFKEIFILTLALIGLVSAGNLMPDPQHPILFSRPNLNFDPEVRLKFALDPKGRGLGFNQVIGVVFPANFKTAPLAFDASLKYSCALTLGLTTISVAAVKPSSSNEGNIAYCQLNDKTNTMINAGEILTLKVTLSGVKFTTNWIRGMRLFTASSNKDSKIYIDSSPYIGSVSLYADALAYSTSSAVIEMSAPTMSLKGVPATSITPETKFDVSLNFNSKLYLNKNDFILTFKFDNLIVSAPTSVTSTRISTASPDDKLSDLLLGTLDIKLNTAKDMITIGGINEDLIPGRKFTLNLKDFTALSTKTNQFSALEMNVYYKNTNSLLVKQSTTSSSNIFKVIPNVITLTANHPDSFDIFRGGLFPTKFTFKTNNDINSPVNIVLQHSNAIQTKIEYSFVASTCDFSENDVSFASSFGSRPTCYPLRTDFAFPTAASDKEFNGSGIFFRLASMKSTITYTVTVWGSADNCGGDLTDNFFPIKLDTIDVTKTKYKYSMTAYGGIDDTKSNEERFTTQQIIAKTATPIPMGNHCWNALMNLGKAPLDAQSAFEPAIHPFNENSYKTLITTVDSTTNGCDVSNEATKYCRINKDVVLYREFTNIKLINHTTVVPLNNYLGDLSGSADNKAERYLYGTSAVGPTSYFALTFEFPVIASKKIFEFIPTPVATDPSTASSTAYNVMRVQPGRLEFKFQKQWFALGDTATGTPGCYIGWGINDSTLSYTKNVMRNIATPVSTKDCTKIIKNGQHNFLTTYTNNKNENSIDCSNAVPNLDTTNSIFPIGDTSSKSHFKILSIWTSSGKGAAFTANNKSSGSASSSAGSDESFGFPIETESLNAALNSDTSKTYGLFSSCLKFNTPPTTIKTLFLSMDIQINYLYSLLISNTEKAISDSIPHRSIRLIKLFPEGGVFQDVTSNSKKIKADSTTNYPNLTANAGVNASYKLHFSLGSSTTSTGICLIEIYGLGLGATADSTSNVLGIWIGFGVLLETDYNDLTATYPVSPLASITVTSYGLQSSYNMNMNSNPYVHKLLTNDNDIKLTKSNLSLDLHQYAGVGATAAAADNVQNYRSSYTFLMGSLVLINGITNGAITTNSNADNLLIPIYCPIVDDSKGKGFINGLPTLYMAFLSMTSYTSITSVNMIFTQKISSTKFTSVISSVGLSYRGSGQTAAAKVFSDSSNYQNYLFTLRWADYTSTLTDNDSLLYLFYGSIAANSRTFTPADESYCSGYVLLLSDSLIVDKTKLKSTILTNTVPQYYNNSTKKFYYLGLSYTKAIMFGLGNKVLSGNEGKIFEKSGSTVTSLTPFGKTSTLSITGIKRPSIDTYYDSKTNTYIGPNNSIGFFCSTYTNIKESFTNYLPNSITNLTGTFFLDFNPLALASSTDPKIGVTFSRDSGDVFFSDSASNVKMALTLPYLVPGGWTLKFKSSNTMITADTICGLIQGASNSAVVDCTNTSLEIICPLNSSSLTYSLCCYSVKTNPAETLKINSLKIEQPAQPSAAITYNTVEAYTVAEAFDSTTILAAKPAIDQAAKITSINYSHVLQENGYGKLHMTINLPRDPVRNMIITVAGDLKDHKIKDITPRCMASFGREFGDNWNGGDILLDSCNVAGLDAITSPIIVTTKNIVYRCGLSFSSSRNLNIMIWPVKVANWLVAPYKDSTYNVKMQLNSASPINIALSTSNDKFTSTLNFLPKPLFEENDNLCNISKVFPLLPGELAEYIFDFDLDTSKDKYEKSTLNEVSIFFNYEDFGGINNNIICKFEGALTHCAFSDEGILNIRFASSLKVGLGKKISVSVMNIINPTVYTDLRFTCTVNNLTGGVRTNVITGRGKLTNGIKLNDAIAEGNLRFVNLITVNDSNPRVQSTHILRVTFDEAVGLTKLPITIEKNPFIMVTFPSNYNFKNYPNIKLTCGLDEYLTPENTTKIEKVSLNVKECITMGNAVVVTLNNDKYTFNANFRYWDIKIQQVQNPDDTTSPTGANTTGQFSILISNSDFSRLYRSYQNLDNVATNAMTTPIDEYIAFNRGIEFKFDDKKWIVDFMNGSEKNSFNIKPGRFLNVNIIIRNPNANIDFSVGNISLSDSLFKLAAKSYQISPLIKTPVPIYIGVPCGTLSGRYLINFVNTESIGNNFAPLVPILAIVDSTATPAMASIIISSDTIPSGSNLFVRFNLEEPNVDELTITFTSAKGVTNDPTAKITETKIASSVINAGSLFDLKNNPIVEPNVIEYSLFSITSDIKTTQSFVASSSNTCYSFKNSNLNINFSGEIAKLTDIDYSTSFKYINTEKERPVELNALRFTFTPPVFPIILACALVCNNANFPSDETITAYKTPSTPLVNYYMGQFSDKSVQTITFQNLVRDMQYKMKCVIRNTNAKALSVTDSKTFNFSQGNLTDSSSSFITQKTENKTCIQYVMNEVISKTSKQKLIDYCQKLFIDENWSANGCVICHDSTGTMMATGVNMPNNVICTNNPNQNKTLRFLQTGNSTVIVPVTTISTFTVCATPSLLCATNVKTLAKQPFTYTMVMGELSKRTVKSPLMEGFGISNSTFNSSILFSDESNVDISSITFESTSIDKDGSVSWKAVNTATTPPLNCPWMITEKSKQATKDLILGCTAQDWCGKDFKVSTYSLTGRTDPNYKKAFVAGQEYTLNFICSKDLPSPLFYSVVKTVDLSIPNKPTTDTTKSDTAPVVPPTEPKGSSGLITMSINYLLILIFILF